MNLVLRFVMLCLLLLIAPLPVLATSSANAAAMEGLELLRRGFADVQDFTAEIVQEKQVALLKRKMTSRGVVRFRKPDQFYMELYPPYASRLLLRNNTIDLYLVKENINQHMVLPPEQSLKHWFAFLAKPVTSLPEGVEVKAEQRGGGYTLQITPRTRGQVKRFTVTVLEDGRLKRLAIEEQNSDRTVIEFQQIRKNTGLTDREFRLE
jgi:outer membrane lipoprotein carrier protein